MNSKVNRQTLLPVLAIATNIADRKSTMPILSHVRLRTVGKDRLRVAATDLIVSLVAEVPSENSSDGGLTVGAKVLHDVVYSLPGGDVSVRRTDNNLAEIQASKVNYRLVGTPDRDFPVIPKPGAAKFHTIDARSLRAMIDRTLFSVSNDEIRFHGVLFESDGTKARMVSTDGHRLSKVERALEGLPTLSEGIIIPKKGMQEIKRVVESSDQEVQIAIKRPYVFVRRDSMTLVVKLTELQFPPYQMVIPAAGDRLVVIDRIRLLAALKRAQPMTLENRATRLKAGQGELTIISESLDIGEFREVVPATTTDGTWFWGANPRYLIEALSAIDSEKVSLSFGAELDPLLITSDDYDYIQVVMPMRI